MMPDCSSNRWEGLNFEFKPGGTDEPQWMAGVRGLLTSDVASVEPQVARDLLEYFDAERKARFRAAIEHDEQSENYFSCKAGLQTIVELHEHPAFLAGDERRKTDLLADIFLVADGALTNQTPLQSDFRILGR